MEVKLLHRTPLHIVIKAIRTCYDSLSLSDSEEKTVYVCKKCGGQYFSVLVCPKCNEIVQEGEKQYVLGTKDKKLLANIIKNGHTSTIEHMVFSFEINGLPRYVLQELVRHRMASYSVKSTRYTLSELKKESIFTYEDRERANKYVEFTGLPEIDNCIIRQLESLRQYVLMTQSNDILKTLLPESYKCNLVLTINARSLRNFLELRLSKRAHFKIRELAASIAKEIKEKAPEAVVLFEDLIW